MKLFRWLVLVPLVAFVAWFFLGGELSTDDAVPGTPVSEQSRAQAPNEFVAPAEVVESSARATQVAETPSAPSETSSDLVPLSVRERGTSRTISGATVCVLELGEGAGELSGEENRDFARAVLALETRGTRYTSDADGRALLPRVKGEALLCARAGELFGTLHFRKYANELVVELAPNADLEVLVRDDLGRGAPGVPLTIRPVGPSLTEDISRFVATTDDNGRALLRDARALVEREAVTYAVHVGAVTAQPIERDLDFGAWPHEPIAFDLPPCGSVDVHVLNASGALVRHDTPTWLVAVTTSGEKESEWAERAIRVGERRIPLAGIAHFAHVQVGLSLCATTEGAGFGLATPARFFEGPRLVGEQSTVELGGPTGFAVLHGRAVDEQGAPLTDGVQYHLTVTLDRNGAQSLGTLTSAVDGTFSLELQPSNGQTARRSLVLRTSTRSAGETPRSVELSFDGDLAPGIHELGDIVVSATPLLVAGRVVDDTGAPQPDVALLAFEPSVPGARRAWADETVASSASGPDGRFGLYGVSASRTLGVQVLSAHFAPREIETVLSGSRELELVVTRGASLAGEVLVEPDMPLLEIQISCRPDREAANGTRGFSAQPRPLPAPGRGSFSIGGLPAGSASVEFTVRNGPVLVRFDGVELVPGEKCADPRLVEVDLRGLSKALHVVVRDEGGEGIPESMVRARGRDGTVEWSRVDTDDGHATVRARGLPIDFVLGASGYRTERVDGASEDFEVRLERGLPVELVLDADSRALLDDDATLAVVYERGTLTTSDDAIWWPELAKPDAEGVARVRVCEPGLFRVELQATRRRDERTESFSAPCTPATIDVRDSDEPQRFEVTLAEPERARLRAFREP